jgi:hypothetical protein
MQYILCRGFHDPGAWIRGDGYDNEQLDKMIDWYMSGALKAGSCRRRKFLYPEKWMVSQFLLKLRLIVHSKYMSAI